MQRRTFLQACGAGIVAGLLPRPTKPRPLRVGPGQVLRLQPGKHYPHIVVDGGRVVCFGTSTLPLPSVGRLVFIRGRVEFSSLAVFERVLD